MKKKVMAGCLAAIGLALNSFGWGGLSNGVFEGCKELEKFFANWNAGDRDGAMTALGRAISIADNDSALGHGCSGRMKVLLAKAKSGDLPSRFDERDYSGSVANNLISFVYQPVWDQHNGYCDRTASRFQALGNSFSAKTAVYKKEGEMQEFLAKQEVQKNYLKKTGDNFDPDNKPSYDSGKQEEWKKAKRIYDIYAK